MQYEWIVSLQDNSVSLLEFLQKRLSGKGYSMRKIKGWIDAGYCFVKNAPVRFSRQKVIPNSKVLLRIPRQQKKEMPILFEDEAILLLDKPAGVTCDERLVKELAKLQKALLLVHRLDKETSGVLLLAKSQEVLDYFIEQFRSERVSKRYLAIVDGQVLEDAGTIENYIGPIRRYQGHVVWGKAAKDGHLAVTCWRVLKRSKKATLLELLPKTGRTHQLRVHTSQMGHPILGDYTYGKSFRAPFHAPRVLLHAEELSFIHPTTGQRVTFSAPMPKDFIDCQEALF